MILRNPLPDPELTRRFNDVETLETPALIPRQPRPQLSPDPWTPPPYWKNLLYMEESKFEQICKKWFLRVIVVAASLYLLALVSIFLWKVLMMVVSIK